jgi:hypothetical protein
VGPVLAIFRQSMEIPVEFKPSMTIAANRSSKADIPIPTDGMI